MGRLLMVLILSSCMANRQIKISSSKEESGENKNAPIDLSRVGSANLKDQGILKFFLNENDGASLKQIRWRKPLSSLNPGIDCVLNKTNQNASGTFFHCEVEKWGNKIKVDVFEQIREGRRELIKIQIWGNEKYIYQRWANELSLMGFKERGQASSKSRTFYLKNTQAVLKFMSGDVSAILELNPVQL